MNQLKKEHKGAVEVVGPLTWRLDRFVFEAMLFAIGETEKPPSQFVVLIMGFPLCLLPSSIIDNAKSDFGSGDDVRRLRVDSSHGRNVDMNSLLPPEGISPWHYDQMEACRAAIETAHRQHDVEDVEELMIALGGTQQLAPQKTFLERGMPSKDVAASRMRPPAMYATPFLQFDASGNHTLRHAPPVPKASYDATVWAVGCIKAQRRPRASMQHCGSQGAPVLRTACEGRLYMPIRAIREWLPPEKARCVTSNAQGDDTAAMTTAISEAGWIPCMKLLPQNGYAWLALACPGRRLLVIITDEASNLQHAHLSHVYSPKIVWSTFDLLCPFGIDKLLARLSLSPSMHDLRVLVKMEGKSGPSCVYAHKDPPSRLAGGLDGL